MSMVSTDNLTLGEPTQHRPRWKPNEPALNLDIEQGHCFNR
jgi:hypothetical protein